MQFSIIIPTLDNLEYILDNLNDLTKINITGYIKPNKPLLPFLWSII